MDLMVWEKEKKKNGKKKELTEGTEKEKSKEEEEEEEEEDDDDAWVCERREMNPKNKSNNGVACFYWLA